MSYLEKVKELDDEQKSLNSRYKDLFDNRPLPSVWKVGQKVRYLQNSEWAWIKGGTAYVKELRPEYEGKPAKEYQVFYTGPKGKGGIFWTTPEDVELVEDVE